MQEENPRQMTRRSKLETCFAIIEVMAKGVEKPTHIMYKANLSWSVMQDYIKSLERQGLITITGAEGRRVFHLTTKGFDLLSKYLEIKEDIKNSEGMPQNIVVS